MGLFSAEKLFTVATWAEPKAPQFIKGLNKKVVGPLVRLTGYGIESAKKFDFGEVVLAIAEEEECMVLNGRGGDLLVDLKKARHELSQAMSPFLTVLICQYVDAYLKKDGSFEKFKKSLTQNIEQKNSKYGYIVEQWGVIPI